MDLATSGKGGIGSFIGLCAISAAFGVADAYVQGGMIGDLSFMLPEFIQVSNFQLTLLISCVFICLFFTMLYSYMIIL